MTATTTLAVVIPFYQRDGATLVRAVRSIDAQHLPADVQLTTYVVDDASPLPAEAALRELGTIRHRLEIVHRRNGGPGAARNSGLDQAAALGADYVAFLDSDDFWYPDHLATALVALRDGSSFYFANSADVDEDSFAKSHYFQQRRTAPGQYQPPEATISATDAFEALLAECLPHTSQVVYDFRRHGHVRFDERLRRAGEDHACWIEICAAADRVSYSTRVMGARGTGVSIYRAALEWDSSTAPARLIDELAFRSMLLARYGRSQPQRAILQDRLRHKQLGLAFLIVRSLARNPRLALDTLARMAVRQPRFLLDFPRLLPELPSFRRKLADGELLL